jgi:hypothetical protein
MTVTYQTDPRSPAANSSVGGAYAEIFGIGALALVAMGLLAFGYNTRESDTRTARGGEMSIQAQQPDRKNFVAPDDKSGPPTSSNTGQGPGNGDQPPARQ